MWWLRVKRAYWRWRIRQNSHVGPLLSCWQEDRLRDNQSWLETEFLVIDTETSALDPEKGELLSIGWVVIREGKIQLKTARHYLLKPTSSVGDSATIHQLRDCEFNNGLPSEQALSLLLEAAKNRVLVFHHQPLDMGFLNRISRQHYGAPLLLPVIDTLLLEKQWLERREIPIMPSMLRLSSCRDRHQLPPYPAHNALVDALATAELLLSQLVRKGYEARLKVLR